MACGRRDAPLLFKLRVEEIGPALAKLDQFHFARVGP